MKQTDLLWTVLSLIGLSVSSWASAPPADAPLPGAAETLERILDQTSIIIDGRVTQIDYTYDDQSGPWTVATLSEVRTLLGEAVGSTLTVRTRGGHLPDGRFLAVPELASFKEGERYVVFLRNTSWSWSPVVRNFALRVVSDGGREALASNEGIALEGVNSSGLVFSTERRFKAPSNGRNGIAEQSAEPEAARSASSTPAPALGVSELIASLQTDLASRNASLHGSFYDLPKASSWQRTELVPAQGDITRSTQSQSGS